MPSYIFVTHEGFTYSPDPNAISPDVVNMQVLGTAAGDSQEQAFENLAADNPDLLGSAFDEVQCIELKYDSYDEQAKWFYLSDARKGPDHVEDAEDADNCAHRIGQAEDAIA